MTTSTYSSGQHTQRWASRRRRMAADSSRIGVRAIVVGAALILVAAGWPLPVGTTLLLGVAVLLWVLASMAAEDPETGP